MNKYEVSIVEYEPRFKKYSGVMTTETIEAETLEEVIKKSKAALKKIDKDLLKRCEKDRAEFSPNIPLTKGVITSIELV